MLSVLDRLKAGEVIVGDGSYVFTLEKRGYVKVTHPSQEVTLLSIQLWPLVFYQPILM